MVSDVLQWFRSIVFNVQMYLAMAVMGVALAPLVLIDGNWAFRAVHLYCRYVRWSARVIVGLETEVRGYVPADEVLVASKHQSFLDIIMIVSVLPRPKFIMKKELLWAPFLGWYATRMGCVPVDRGKRSAAVEQMLKDVEAGRRQPGQLIIYPQGTRVAPGSTRPYKFGTAALYVQLGRRCVPAATNVGVFWARRGVMRRPGLAVVEFLRPIPPGLEPEAFMKRLESEIETASDRLMREAGHPPALTESRHDPGT
jgi:1-acyl-sn-glycerol-3-phosphate acyltransferase